MIESVRTGYEIRAGSAMLADRFADVGADVATCDCGETLSPAGKCLNVGECRRADVHATSGSLTRGAKAVGVPQAWTIGGRVD